MKVSDVLIEREEGERHRLLATATVTLEDNEGDSIEIRGIKIVKVNKKLKAQLPLCKWTDRLQAVYLSHDLAKRVRKAVMNRYKSLGELDEIAELIR